STTFNVPDLRERFIVGVDDSTYDLGDTGGAAAVTLTTSQMPSHTHSRAAHTHSMSHSHSMTHTHSINPPNTSTTSNGNHGHEGRFRFFDQGTGTVAFWTAVRSIDSAGTTEVSSITFGSTGAHTHSVNIGSF